MTKGFRKSSRLTGVKKFGMYRLFPLNKMVMEPIAKRLF
jgi:hypothetical protein